MSYRNKTYVAFASEDIGRYRLMEAWRENEHIDFDFFDAHDMYISRDSSKPETIRANLRERMKNAKQFVLLGSTHAKKKSGDGVSFLAYEVETMVKGKRPGHVLGYVVERGLVRGDLAEDGVLLWDESVHAAMVAGKC